MLDQTDKSGLNHVGHHSTKPDAVEKLTGEALYTGDLKMPGMLYAMVKKSPHARARINKIDISKAEKMPGVRAVLCGKELDYRIGLYIVDKFILARDMVRHFGEAVAAVAADTPLQAKAAIDSIEVEYEVLPAVLDPVDALKENAPLVHPDLGSYEYFAPAFNPKPGTNIANLTTIRKGDIEKGFSDAKWIIERDYTNPSVQHVPMETHVAIAKWGSNDNLTIWTSAQSPFTVRNLICHSFNLPHNNVRVHVPHVGGGFGGKAGVGIEPLVAVLSRKAGGKPVRFQATREEEFSLLPCRSALAYRIKTGIDSKGKITAQQMTMYWDSGAYADYAVNVTRACGYSAAGPYEIPNAWVDAYTIYTNKPYGTAFRGFGHVEFHWGIERQMELCAQTIGMDPVEFRKLNAVREGSKTLTGEVLMKNSGDVLKCLDIVSSSINYGKLTEEEQERQERTGRKIGKGVGLLHKAPAMPPFTATAVVIKMNEDGTVNLNLALTDFGQGTLTSVRQIAAERLGFPENKVRISFERDTDKDPYDWQTVASKGLFMTGNATILAVEDLLKNAYSLASTILCAQECDLGHDPDGIFIRHHPAKRVSFAAMAIGYAMPNGNGIGGPLMGVGRYIAQGLTHLDKETGQGNPALEWTFGAHGIIVEVDESTGEYDVLKVVSAFDVGKAINPDIVRGQCVGGMIQGLGTAMCEGYIFDKEGHLLNPSFTDNKIPTSMDIPETIESVAVETPQIDGPYGARGVGEHSMISVAPALGNAIKNATGVELLHMPIRFEDVWRAIRKKENTAARTT